MMHVMEAHCYNFKLSAVMLSEFYIAEKIAISTVRVLHQVQTIFYLHISIKQSSLDKDRHR